MSEVIKGKLEEIVAVKSGTGKRGKWTLWAVKVDGERYGTKFDKPKAAIGDLVEFEVEENENGYNDVVDGTFEVKKKATSAESAATSKANGESNVAKQDSIERQVVLKCAVELAVVEGGIAAVAENFNTLLGILHPVIKQPPVTQNLKAKAKPKDEDEDPPY